MAIAGKLGKIEYGGGKVLGVRDWSLDIDNDIRDVTTWTTGTDQWRTKLAGLSDWTGSIGGFYDPDNSTGQVDLQTNTLTPTTAQLILYADRSEGSNFRGSVLVSRMSIGTAVDADATVGWDIEGTGALTYSTAT